MGLLSHINSRIRNSFFNWNTSTDETAQRVGIVSTDGNQVSINDSGQMKIVLDGKVATCCSSSATLAGNAVFAGTTVDTLDYSLIFVTVFSDVTSATDGLVTKISSDGITWRYGDSFTINANTEKTFSFQTNKQYFKVEYTNGSTDQSIFDLQTIFKKTNSKPSSHRISESISPEDDATLQKAVLTALNDNGFFTNINATKSNNLKVANVENGLSIAKGDVVGHSVMSKFGENSDIDTGTTPEDIWDFGGLYNFSITADIDSISSSDVGDTQDVVVVGLDTNWEEVSQTVTLNGQTRVALSTSLIRSYRAYNDDTTDFNGNVYIYSDTTLAIGVPVDTTAIRAMVSNGNNQTLMCVYTVPAGKTAYFMTAYVSLSSSRASNASFTLRARPFGKVFRVVNKIGIMSGGSSTFTRVPAVPGKFPEKTDVKIRCEEVSVNATAVAAGFDLILVDN